MPEIITKYNLLISCPGDVKDEIEIIDKAVDEFNDSFGTWNKIHIVCNHWSKNSYPKYGKHPQTILNEQFVKNCDLAIAVFWTRFGTPTDEYGSGSEEEIEEMIKDQKQVFLYFLNKKIDINKIDHEQWEKVQEFKKRYRSNGLYFEVDDINDFGNKVRTHLTKYFLDKASEENLLGGNFIIEAEKKPELKIKDTQSLLTNEIKIREFDLREFLNRIKEKIIDKINVIKAIDLRLENNDQEDMMEKPLFYYNYEKTEFNKKDKELIQKFVEENKIEIKEGFWDVGKLESKKHEYSVLSIAGMSTNEIFLHGSDSEKQKYNLIVDLVDSIKSYDEKLDYILQLENLYVLSLVLSNDGNTFDEDITVNLYFEKNILITEEDFPLPGMHIIEELNDNSFAKELLSVETNENIEKYNSMRKKYLNNMTNFIPYLTRSYEDEKEDFIEMIEDMYEDYNYNFKRENDDVLWMKFNYIKHNTNIAFPALLLFREKPSSIRYSIRSKHLSEVIDGEVSIN